MQFSPVFRASKICSYMSRFLFPKKVYKNLIFSKKDARLCGYPRSLIWDSFSGAAFLGSLFFLFQTHSYRGSPGVPPASGGFCLFLLTSAPASFYISYNFLGSGVGHTFAATAASIREPSAVPSAALLRQPPLCPFPFRCGIVELREIIP